MTIAEEITAVLAEQARHRRLRRRLSWLPQRLVRLLYLAGAKRRGSLR